MSAAEQLVEQSQAQYQRYCQLFGAKPVGGEGLRGLASQAGGVAQQVRDVRGQVIGSQFSTAVLGPYTEATRHDPTPFDDAVRFAGVTATVTDASAKVNVDGARGVAAAARAEASEVAAVPDPDSAEGLMQIVEIINRHQQEASAIVSKSAASEQALGQRAADAGGGHDAHQKPASTSPDDVIVRAPSDRRDPTIQLVDFPDDSGIPGAPGAQQSGGQGQIGPFSVPAQVAAAAGPLLANDPLNGALRRLGDAPTAAVGGPPAPLTEAQVKTLIDAAVKNQLDEAERFSLSKLLGKTLEGCGFGGITAGVGGLLVGPLDPAVIGVGCVVGSIGDGGKYIFEHAGK